MPRKRTADSTTSLSPTSEENPSPTSPEAETLEPGNSPKQDSAAPPSPSSEPTPPSPSSEPTPPSPSSEPEKVQLQPATFAREGRTMVCTVCGTEARQNLDHQLFCPNAHNHPPLTSEAPKS